MFLPGTQSGPSAQTLQYILGRLSWQVVCNKCVPVIGSWASDVIMVGTSLVQAAAIRMRKNVTKRFRTIWDWEWCRHYFPRGRHLHNKWKMACELHIYHWLVIISGDVIPKLLTRPLKYLWNHEQSLNSSCQPWLKALNLLLASINH